MARTLGSGSGEESQVSSVTTAGFHVLIALLDGPLHGYGIMQRILYHTESQLRIGPGTLYRTIQHLVEDRLIEESQARPRLNLDDPRRRYYGLTKRGRSVLAEEAVRLRRLVRLARNKRMRLGSTGPER